VQAVYVPADDLTDPAPATTFAHLDATTVLSRSIAELGIYPAVDPLDSTSRMLAPNIVGEEHYKVARRVQQILQNYKALQDIIAILGMDELTEADKLTVSRARKIQRFMAQPFQVAEAFTGMQGKLVDLQDTIKGFKSIADGAYDDLPESAFYMIGPVEEAVAKAAELLKSSQAASGKGDKKDVKSADEADDATADAALVAEAQWLAEQKKKAAANLAGVKGDGQKIGTLAMIALGGAGKFNQALFKEFLMDQEGFKKKSEEKMKKWKSAGTSA